MNPFRTVVVPEKPRFQITHQSRLLSIGSCFSERIGRKFEESKFRIHINPFGQQYNPLSIADAIQLLLENKPFTESDLVQHDELWHSFAHHGSFSGVNKEEVLNKINTQLKQAAKDLLSADVLFLTFGSAHVFEFKETGKVVSNCHKMPSAQFTQRLVSPSEIVQQLGFALSKLKTYNSNIKVVFTVSPIRYFAYGYFDNSVSKAHLFTAIHQLQQQFTGSYYFPAYEMVMDDLRDYRFYAEDMLHPSQQATQYVWQRLCEAMLPKATVEVIKEAEEIMQAAKHRPRNAGTEAHKKFADKYLKKIAMLTEKHALDFSDEEELLRKYVTN